MDQNPLKIISSHDNKNYNQKTSRRLEAQAFYDRQWLINPEKFISKNFTENKLQREKILSLLKKHMQLSGLKVADLGCGYGYLSRELRDEGCFVDAIDISLNALKQCEKFDLTNIKLIHDFLPKSFLSDDHYDLVVAVDLISLLKEEEYRLFFSELSRISKLDGYILISTSIDFNSEDAVQKFASLAFTELEFIEWSFSYHFLWIKLKDFLYFPLRAIKGANDKIYRKKAIEQRYSLKKLWYRWNSTPLMSFFWKGINMITLPLVQKLQKNEKFILFLEKISKSIFNERSISHVIVLGRKKRLILETSEENVTELKHKKQVWE